MNSKRNQFGPWATTLHYGSRLELNAFWRRRLARLSALGGGGRRLGVRGRILLGMFASALVVMPRVHWGPAVLAAEAKPQAAVESKQAVEVDEKKEQPFTATFSNGVGIQLVGVSTNPSRGQPWWTPDGMPLADAPYDTLRATISPDRGDIAREICWRWLNVPNDPDFEKKWEIIPSNGSQGGGNPTDANGKLVEGLTASAAGVTGNPETCTIRFRVVIKTTPWEIAFTSQGNVGGSSKVVDGVIQSAMFAKPLAAGGGTAVTVSYQNPGMSTRLVAVDADENFHVPSSKSGAGTNGFEQMTFQFAGVAPEQLKGYDLQVQKRLYETIEFRGVALVAGRRNEVKTYRISSDGTEERLEAPGLSAVAIEQLSNSPETKAANERYERSLVLLKTMADEQGYKLAVGETVKHVPPPFKAAREEYWNLFHYQPRGNLSAAMYEELKKDLDRPGYLIFQWKDSALNPQSSHLGAVTVQRVLDGVFGIKLHRLAGDLSLLKSELAGDWVVSWDAQKDRLATAEDIAALERTLQEELLEVVHLELREVRRPVYVVKGNYKFTAIAGRNGKVSRFGDEPGSQADGTFQIPARRTETSGSVGSYERFLETISELILTPLVDETTAKPAKPSLFWHLSGKPPEDVLKPFEQQTVDAILASLTAQTGFTFVKEERPVKMLFIKRGVRDR